MNACTHHGRTTPIRAGAFVRTAGVLLVLALLVMVGAVRADDPPPVPAKQPTGILFIAGGGHLPDAPRRHFVELAGGKNARIVVIPTASRKADLPNYPNNAMLFFQAEGVQSVTLLHTRDRKLANDPEFVKPLTKATGVWLGGGSQLRLADAYHGTLVEKELRKILARGGVIGGTSAGAAIMSNPMIAGGPASKAARVGEGFGLLDGVFIDMHFSQRHRLPRLLGVLEQHPKTPGVGIDESTVLIVRGSTATVEGVGNVRVCFLSPGTAAEAKIQVLKNGDKLDLLALQKAVAGL